MGLREWLSPRARRGGRPSAPGAAQPPTSDVHHSLGLPALLAGFGGERKRQVLDLGPAVGSNIEFLSGFGCRLYIEDYFAALASRGHPAGRPDLAILPDLARFPLETRFDAVLAWDLFNYLERRELAALGQALLPACQPGAVLFALISIGKTMPAQPGRYRMVDVENLAYERVTAADRPCPRYAPSELAELLRGFRLDRSFLLRHGIQEYLFTREPD